ncbi:MAG: type II toxin-antitoxin system prevent-host-death family antitoxin [Homoserinimonas sp.]
MSLVPVRDLRNNTAAVIERARNGEEVTITVNGVPAATLVPVQPAKKAFLTPAELVALAPRPGEATAEFWDHELDGDTTDDLGPAE